MLNNLTTKFQEALMQAQQTAGRLGKPEISSLDVLVALLEQEGGILSPILRKASCDPGLLLQAAQREVSHEPTQSGATTQPQMGRDLATVMQAAEEERKKLKDDYLSVEHFMLGALDTQNKVHQLTDTFGLTKDNYLAAMKEVRGNQRVTDDNPEGKYQTLEKYGTDLTARARAGKIDPVIGRDTEIRRVLQILSRRTKNGACEVLKGLEAFREHLGGHLTVLMLTGIGRGKDVHEIDAALMEECIREMQEAAGYSIQE